MAGISKKEVRIILASAEEQGCTLKATKNGVRILHPDGETTFMLHWSTSDSRAMGNVRAEFRRAKLRWPFD